MKNKIYAALLIVLVLVTYTVTSKSKSVALVTWEYKMVTLPSEKKLNELGNEGWELSAIDAKGGAMGSATVGTYVFKRAK